MMSARAPFCAGLSLPSRERGSKQLGRISSGQSIGRSPRGSVDRNLMAENVFSAYQPVAPLAGAWIETLCLILVYDSSPVAPLAGAWIETMIHCVGITCHSCRSPRGSVDRNYAGDYDHYYDHYVAPLAGAWIETPSRL